MSDQHQPLRDMFPYETIKFSGRLEILDRHGAVAVFTRRQRVRFLENNVTVFFDRVWGDGVLFAGYSVDALRILDLIPARKGYMVPLALPRPFSKGETFDIITRRRIVGAFVQELAYWESIMPSPTERITLDVIAPAGRRFGPADIVAPPEGDFDAGQARGRLSMRVREPALDIPYRLAWSWK